uniref:(California timema) hypothetical protein n=1 Tax=Timema californicum TaxID=61474 RepID=A0A7R9P8V3_TIMCA|nr:unnamed protein product [Timema californicum]
MQGSTNIYCHRLAVLDGVAGGGGVRCTVTGAKKIRKLYLSLSDVDKDLVRAPGMGRITGSASIETLVRVGIEKENGLAPDSKMVVLHDFTPCVDDELEVKRGQVILAFNYTHEAFHDSG